MTLVVEAWCWRDPDCFAALEECLAHLRRSVDRRLVLSVRPRQSFARSTYEPSSVWMTTRVPAPTCGGTMVRTPLSRMAGL